MGEFGDGRQFVALTFGDESQMTECLDAVRDLGAGHEWDPPEQEQWLFFSLKIFYASTMLIL